MAVLCDYIGAKQRITPLFFSGECSKQIFTRKMLVTTTTTTTTWEFPGNHHYKNPHIRQAMFARKIKAIMSINFYLLISNLYLSAAELFVLTGNFLKKFKTCKHVYIASWSPNKIFRNFGVSNVFPKGSLS